MKYLYLAGLFFIYFDANSQDTPMATESSALVYFQAQDYQNALARYLEMDTTDLEILNKIAFSQFKMGQLKDAKVTYRKILRKDSLHIPSHLYLGTIYDREYYLSRAIKHYSRLIQIDSTNPSYHKLCGKAYDKAGLPRLAFQYYANALNLNRSDIALLVDISELMLRNKQFHEADSLVKEALKLDSTNIQGLLIQSRCDYAFKDYDLVARGLEKVKRRLDLVPFYKKMLGYAYLQMDSLDQAIYELRNLLDQEVSEITHFYLASAYFKTGKLEEARYHYENAIKEGTSTNLANYYRSLAIISKENDNLKTAIKHYEDAFYFSKNPEFIILKAQASETYYKDKGMAIRQYKRYLQFSGENRYDAFARERIQALNEYLHLTGKRVPEN